MRTDFAISRLVNAGAALLMRTDPTPIPVTWWRRVHPGRHFYFTPGEDTFAGHAFDCAQERVLYDGEAVEFRAKDASLVAYLAPIGEQESDPEAVKSLAAEVVAWKAHFKRDQKFRAYVLAEYGRATIIPHETCSSVNHRCADRDHRLRVFQRRTAAVHCSRNRQDG